MAQIHYIYEDTAEEVARRSKDEAEETTRFVFAATLYVVSGVLVCYATWTVLSLVRRVFKNVWHYWTVRRPIEMAKRKE